MLLIALVACGKVEKIPPDGLPIDDAPVDTSPPPDGSMAFTSGQELTSAAGRVTSTTYTMDVQLGHVTSQNAIQSTSYHLEPNTVIKP
jgi:hypothetical protein